MCPAKDDSGNKAQIALDWKFNSWGEKYGAYDLDDVIPQRLAARYEFECLEVPLVLEGGSIDVNGAGSLLTTESCLLNPNRNPGIGKADIEEYLRVLLGVSNILWLGDGIAGDDTDGHIDDLARFVSPDTIVTVTEDEPRRRQPQTAGGKPQTAARDARSERQPVSNRDAADAACAVP